MAAALRAAGTVGVAGRSSIDIDVPAEAQAGDFMYVALEKNGFINEGAGPNTGDNWELDQNATSAFPSGATLWTILTEDDLGTTQSFSWVTGEDFCCAVWIVVSGIDPDHPLDVPSTWDENYSDGTQPVCPGLTTVTDGCFLLAVEIELEDVTWTPPGGWTVQASITKGAIATSTQETAGPTGDVHVATSTDGQWLASLVALRPQNVPTDPPENTGLPQITGIAQTGQTVAVDTGTWGNEPVTSFTYEWFRDGSPISGQTGDTYTLVLGDAGHDITVGVIATNVAGDSEQAVSLAITPTVPGGGADTLVRVNGAWVAITRKVRVDGEWL